jgi:hypothetical protein
MTANEVKLHSSILCITTATTNRKNATVQHFAIKAYCHAEFVIAVAPFRPSPYNIALFRE